MSVAKNYGGKAPLDKTKNLAFCGVFLSITTDNFKIVCF